MKRPNKATGYLFAVLIGLFLSDRAFADQTLDCALPNGNRVAFNFKADFKPGTNGTFSGVVDVYDNSTKAVIDERAITFEVSFSLYVATPPIQSVLVNLGVGSQIKATAIPNTGGLYILENSSSVAGIPTEPALQVECEQHSPMGAPAISGGN